MYSGIAIIIVDIIRKTKSLIFVALKLDLYKLKKKKKLKNIIIRSIVKSIDFLYLVFEDIIISINLNNICTNLSPFNFK